MVKREKFNFKNGESYNIEEEIETSEKFGMLYPLGIDSKKIIFLGPQGSGKSYSEKQFRGEDPGKTAHNEVSIDFSYLDHLKKHWFDDPRFQDFLDESTMQAMDLHLKYNFKRPKEFEYLAGDHYVLTDERLLRRPFSGLGINTDGITLSEKVKRDILFEFRVFPPERLLQLTRERFEAQHSDPNGFEFQKYNPNESKEDKEKQLYILLQTANYLQEQGAQVHLRTDFDSPIFRLTS